MAQDHTAENWHNEVKQILDFILCPVSRDAPQCGHDK